MLNERRFFRGWIAGLRALECRLVDTRKDVHHRQFAKVVDELREARASGDAVARDMLVEFVASPFTERFDELDSALVEHQRGEASASAQNPEYAAVQLRLSKEQALAILESYTSDERALFERLARTFIESTEAPDERNGRGRASEERRALW